MLTQKQAWQAVKESFAESKLLDSGYGTIRNANFHAGMCAEINHLYVSKRVRLMMANTIEDALTENRNGCYLYPQTKYGARKRREFCQKQIDRLTRKK